MPRKKSPPAYRRHKARNCAVVTLDGHCRYLGPYGSPESHEKYARLIAEWNSKGSVDEAPDRIATSGKSSANSIAELMLAYWRHVEQYYQLDGKPTGAHHSIRAALRYLHDLYGLTQAAEFGPNALKNVRQAMIDAGLSRLVINDYVNRIRSMFRWAVENEMLNVEVYQALLTVTGLRYGRTTAREMDPIKPVPDEHVDAILPYVAPQVAAMIQVQRCCALRPSEVTTMRIADIDMSDDVWVYTPQKHKNQWRGHQRRVPLGPRAQRILQPFLTRADDAFLFSPKKAEADRNAKRRTARKSPMTPSQAKRRPKANRKRAQRDSYDRDSYRRAVKYGIIKANLKRKDDEKIPDWCPLQLRHSRATEVRKQYGLDSAQTYLGHKNADVTQIYAERDLSAAVRIARESG